MKSHVKQGVSEGGSTSRKFLESQNVDATNDNLLSSAMRDSTNFQVAIGKPNSLENTLKQD